MRTEEFNVFSVKPEDTFNMGLNAFNRAGSWFGIFVRPSRFASGATVGDWGCSDIFINTRRGSVIKLKSNLLLQLIPVHHGEIIPFAVSATPTELIVRTAYGTIKCTFAETSLIMIKGENGLGLRLECDTEMHDFVRKRGEKGWECGFRYVCGMVFNPVKGSMKMDSRWDYERLLTTDMRGEVMPDGNGEFLLAVEEFTQTGAVRAEYPTYEEALADVTADWESFLEKQPPLSGEFEGMREKAAYITWSHLVSPSGHIKRPYLYMYPAMAASSWQMCENAVCLKNNLPLAVELLLNMIDRQSDKGQLPDFYDDVRVWDRCFKPPIQGWALDILMREHDLKKEVPKDKLVYMYEGFGKWAEWFMKYRDDDEDGIPQYEHGDETGNDDSPLFKYSSKVELPELCAFIALLYEKLGDLAVIVDRPEESEAWYEKSRVLIDKMIKTFWNGERFVGRTFGDHRVIDGTSLHFYRPLVLGKRLPPEILEKMTADLAEEGGYLTPYGYMAERLTSIDYSRSAFGRGAITSSDNILIITALYYAGKTDLAREVAGRFCRGIMGIDTPFWPAQIGFPGTWGACAFQIMANMYCNM
ncbi:MAG: hypothetical protein IJH99_05860 [Eubacterium sp.]|nr:hypothetical protein [Eubacterium sp.]